MMKILQCPNCKKEDKFDLLAIVSGKGTDTHNYIQIHCSCSDDPVMQFVVDLTPEFNREGV